MKDNRAASRENDSDEKPVVLIVDDDRVLTPALRSKKSPLELRDEQWTLLIF